MAAPARQASPTVASHRLGPHACRLAGARAPRGRRLCRRVVVRHARTSRAGSIVHTRPAGIEIAVDGMSRGQTPVRPVAQARASHDRAAPGHRRRGSSRSKSPAGVQTEQRITWGKAFKSGQARITSTARWRAGHHRRQVAGPDAAHRERAVRRQARRHGRGCRPAASPRRSSSRPGETTELDVPVYSGWIVGALAGGARDLRARRLIGTTEAEKIMLAPGRHKLVLKSELARLRGRAERRGAPGRDDGGVGAAEGRGDRRRAEGDRALHRRRARRRAADRNAEGPARHARVRLQAP